MTTARIDENIVVPLYNLNLNGIDNKAKIDVGEHFRKLSVRISGILDVAGHNATLTTDGILALIKSLSIGLSAGKNPKEITGKMLYKQNTLDEGTPPVLVQPAVTVGANIWSIELVLPFSALNGNPADYTIFNSKRLKDQINNQFNFNVKLGASTDVATPAGAPGDTADVIATTCEIIGEQLIDEPSNNYHPLNQETMKVISLPIVGAVRKVLVDLKSGNKIKRVSILNEVSGVDDDTTIDEIRVRVGTSTYRLQGSWQQLKDKQLRRYGLVANIAGFLALELDKLGNFSNMIDSNKENQVYLEIDTNATCQPSVMVQEILD